MPQSIEEQVQAEVSAILDDLAPQAGTSPFEIYEVVSYSDHWNVDLEGNPAIQVTVGLRPPNGGSWHYEFSSLYSSAWRLFIFAESIQDKIDEMTREPLPSCPLHPHPMTLKVDRETDVARWRCFFHPDLSCLPGEYWHWRSGSG